MFEEQQQLRRTLIERGQTGLITAQRVSFNCRVSYHVSLIREWVHLQEPAVYDNWESDGTIIVHAVYLDLRRADVEWEP